MLNWGIPVYRNDVFLHGGLSDKLISHTDSEVLRLLHARSSLLPSHTTRIHSADRKGGVKKKLRSEKKIVVRSGSALCCHDDDRPPPPPKTGGRLRLRDGRRKRMRSCGHATLDLQLPDKWESRGGRGGGKRQPKQTSWRHSAKCSKINDCSAVALTFVGSDT